MWKRCGGKRGRGLFLLFERGEKLFVCREALNSKSENYNPLRSRIFMNSLFPLSLRRACLMLDHVHIA